MIRPGDIVKTPSIEYGENDNYLGVVSRATKIEGELFFEIALIAPRLRSRNDYEGYVVWANPEDVTLVRARPSREQLVQLIKPLQFNDLFSRLAKKYLRVSSLNTHQLRAVKRMLMSILED